MELPSLPRDPVQLGIAAVLGLAIIGALIWTVNYWINLPRENATNKARGVVQEATIDGLGDAAGEALEITREIHTEHVRIEEITRRNQDAIKSAPGADTRAPDVAGALVRGLCEHRTYFGYAGCPAVLGNDGGLGPAGSDDGRAPAD